MKILIVDDSKAMRMIIQRTLRQAGYEGHEVKEACNGADGLERLQAERFDLVLSDWNMPAMSGIELLAKVKEEKIRVRFGFITSEGTLAMRQQASDAGADFLLAKPFTVEAFQLTLRPVLGA
jgi:two-component system chemotaxis response regulator CheY